MGDFCTKLIQYKSSQPLDTNGLVHWQPGISSPSTDDAPMHFQWFMGQLIEAEWRIYVSVNYAIIGSDNGLSPGQRQAIIWTNAGILLIGP